MFIAVFCCIFFFDYIYVMLSLHANKLLVLRNVVVSSHHDTWQTHTSYYKHTHTHTHTTSYNRSSYRQKCSISYRPITLV